jgi:hypothetical protein
MAHFAEIDTNNVVQRVIVVSNEKCLDPITGQEDEILGIAFCKKMFGGTWIQTSYNKNFRNKFAGIGDIYNKETDVFLSPQLYPSWILNEETLEWEAPIPKPLEKEIEEQKKNANILEWDENNINWTWKYVG